MMVATAAQMMNRRQASGTALVAADFVAGGYEINGSPVTASDIVSAPELITANGLEVPGWTVGALIDFVDDAMATLLTMNWTVVVEYQSLWATGDEVLLVVSNPSMSQWFGLYREYTPNTRMLALETGASDSREAIDTDSHGTGLHRIAVTSAPARLSVSVDGDPVISDTSTIDYSGLTRAVIGGWVFEDETENEIYLRSLTIYPPQDDSLLPALSSLA